MKKVSKEKALQLKALNQSRERKPFPRPVILADKRRTALNKESRRKNFTLDY